ncbi:MAG: hypothetical protein WKG32_16930 [Gemmatimonadaceae bacterium]
MIEEFHALVATLDLSRAIGVRDRALLPLGFAGCFRRSELVSLDYHVAEHRDGLVISLAWSKTDQEGEGAEKGIPYGAHHETCSVRALTDWIALAGIIEGPLCRCRPVMRHGRVLPSRLANTRSEVRRLPARRPPFADVRVIAADHRS